jgi:hypothetical protein
LAQQPTADPSARITNPADGTLLFGVVSITGTASNVQLQTYRLDYLAAADTTAGWQPVGRPVTQQVRDSTLGQWDTTTVKDGVYDIRLRVILRNATVLEDYVRGVIVQNQAPTALPTQPPAPTLTATPIAGPTATSLIQQPPVVSQPPSSFATATIPPRTVPPAARVNSSPAAPTPSVVDPGANATVLATSAGPGIGGAIGNAFCAGAFLGAFGIGLYAAYGLLRGRLRRTAH